MGYRLKYLQFAYFSKPAWERPLYRCIRRGQVSRILEIGIGSARRAERMLSLATRLPAAEPVRYTGIDLFEAASDGTGAHLSLKAAYTRLKQTGARIRLVPGDALSGLRRIANELGGTQLVVLAAELDELSWFYLPRVLAAGAQVFRLSEGEVSGELSLVSADEIQHLSAAAAKIRRAA